MIPPPNRPAPLRVDGNAFAFDTMSARVPGILRNVQAANPDYPDGVRAALDALQNALAAGEPVPLLAADPVPPPDYEAWTAAHHEQAARLTPLTWLHSEWFFVETYVYRVLMQAVRWAETGRDPFAPGKDSSLKNPQLWQNLAAMLAVAADPATGDQETRLADLLRLVLWSNRADLSHAAGQLDASGAAPDSDLLVDDRAAAAPYLLGAGGGAVHVVCDNAGIELSGDLALADFLLAHGVEVVALHLKSHPTFLSDATIADAWKLIDAMAGQAGAACDLAMRLRAAWSAGRLRLTAHPFWNSSRFIWAMPDALAESLRAARLVIVKGDANYRRVVGDALWPPETPFADVVGGLGVPLLALRSLKSDTIVGLPAGLAARLDQEEAGWRVSGRRGVIQAAGIAGD